MSDHFLVVIPVDPNEELPQTATALRDALAKLADTDEARIKDYGKVQFIDCGENLERINCPHCDAEVSTEQWHAWMDEDWHGEGGFHLHKHPAPCCGAEIRLNELNYVWMQGFAQWMVSARNQGRGPLSAEELAQLESVAGLRLRAIAQMY